MAARGLELRGARARAAAGIASAVCVGFAVLGFTVTPARAEYFHQLSSSFPVAAGSPTEVAVNQSTGEVYATSFGGNAVEAFNEAGVPNPIRPRLTEADGTTPYPFVNPFGIAVENAVGPDEGDIYVAEYGGGSVLRFGPSGIRDAQPAIKVANIPPEGTGQAGELPAVVNNGGFSPAGLALGPDGDIYVADQSNNVVDVFAPDGAFKQQVGLGYVAGPNGIAVDGSGDLYVTQGGPGLFEFGPDGLCVKLCGSIDSSAWLAVTTDPEGNVYGAEGGRVTELNSVGETVQSFGEGTLSFGRGMAFDNANRAIYTADEGDGRVDVFKAIVVPTLTIGATTGLGPTSGTLNATVDPEGGGPVTTCQFEYGLENGTYGLGSQPCLDSEGHEIGSIAHPLEAKTDVHAALAGLTPETAYHYRLVAADAQGTNASADHEYTPHHVVGLETEAATAITATTATLHGSYVGNGENTHYFFEFGKEGSFDRATPSVNSGADAGPGRTEVSADVSHLDPGTIYQYRVVAENMDGKSVAGGRSIITPKSAPVVQESVRQIHSDSALIQTSINPGGKDAKYYVEYGQENCEVPLSSCAVTGSTDIGSGTGYLQREDQLSGLEANTVYFYRVRAGNSLGNTVGPIKAFATFPAGGGGGLVDDCPNAGARQQTGAALLLDCRAYELVSAANTDGYSVESDLVPGEKPFADFPLASGASGASRLLYSVHDGAIPGTGWPTNRGLDPYVATRGERGWSTEYVGVAANNPFATRPFSSVPSGAGSDLETFAFGGPEGCSPCFEGGYTGVPVHLADGELVQGMTGSISAGPAARPDGYIGEDLSPDGRHLIFGSTSRFAPGGNGETGDTSIYDRDLSAGQTHVVSYGPSGAPLACLQGAGKCDSAHNDANGIAELAISADGSHIVLGQKVSTDEDGNVFWHLYLNVGDSEKTIDLTPGVISEPSGSGFSNGVLFDGMTEDGTKVFFTTADKMTTSNSQDTDASNDVYEAEVSGESATLSRISTGSEGSGNTDSCDPTANEAGDHWNTDSPVKDCSTVAIGGGGGLAESSGEIYFLSPEKLDGTAHGTPGQPNLYLGTAGSPPQFVATLSPNDPAVVDSVREPEVRQTADFQVTPDGNFAAFQTTSPLNVESENGGFSEVYRFDAHADELACVSCDPTNVTPSGNAELPGAGLGLTDDGRVFFNSPDPLVPRDLDEKEDAYEWEEYGSVIGDSPKCESPHGCQGLISTGASAFSSSLLGVSADGTDAFFFTRDSLVPQDGNGQVVKIYDARTNGGFFVVPDPPLCKSSDECHGPGSASPVLPNIGSTGKSGEGNATPPTKPKGGKGRHHHHRRRHHIGHRGSRHTQNRPRSQGARG